MEWSQFAHELYKAYHFDSLYSSLTNVSFGVPSKTNVVLSCVRKAIYNIYFHPLSKYPGPILAKATKIPIALVTLDGSVSQWMSELHNYYRSDVVRISPDELSFVAPSAWKDIYGLRSGHDEFPKDLTTFSGLVNLLTANNADHTRFRRLLSHGFSDKALREQESLIQTYVHNLISGLKHQAQASEGKANLGDWFNYTTFDVIADLSLGTSFDCLKNHDYHPWVSLIRDNIKAIALADVATRFPPLGNLLRLFVPKKLVQAREDHESISRGKVEQRLKTQTTRPDMVAYALRHRDDDKGGMTDEEIHQNMALFIGAGSESTGLLVTGAIWYLLTNPHCLEQANEEVRGRFNRIEDITLKAVTTDLKYLQAVIDETFRLYPPALSAQPRLAPKGGDTVCGDWIPEGTKVKMNQYAVFHSYLNFNSPETFAPSRWLGNEHFKNDKRDALQPFSVGSRNCIGKSLALAEIRLMLTNMLWTFDMELAEETDEEWTKQKAWLTWEKKPLVVKLTERKE
ncbi:MAG: hypothetical protein Q9195_002195 [Heterodermia aff. obscurata]